MFCPTGAVWLHPPWETEEKEELQELWSRLCEELQGRDCITQSSLTQSCQAEDSSFDQFLLPVTWTESSDW